jgi:hypothetical protein
MCIARVLCLLHGVRLSGENTKSLPSTASSVSQQTAAHRQSGEQSKSEAFITGVRPTQPASHVSPPHCRSIFQRFHQNTPSLVHPSSCQHTAPCPSLSVPPGVAPLLTMHHAPRYTKTCKARQIEQNHGHCTRPHCISIQSTHLHASNI